jgi:hypothetical protein
MAAARFGRPAEPPVARLTLPGGGSKNQTGQLTPRAIAHEILQVLAAGSAKAQI